MTSDNHNHNNNNNDVKMEKWRALAVLNIIIGGTVLITNVVTLINLYDWVDWIGIGIWGGCFFISAGSLTMQRNPRLMSMSILAILSGLALVIFYAWNLGVYNSNNNCYYYSYPYYSQSLCDWRLASDIIFIVCGSLALVINMVLTANARKIIIVRAAIHVRTNAYPMTTVTNTTYMVARPTTYPQTVYQVPVNTYPQPQTGVIYQTQPGYPTAQPGYPTVQQQPVYYTQTNPPPYTTTY